MWVFQDLLPSLGVVDGRLVDGLGVVHGLVDDGRLVDDGLLVAALVDDGRVGLAVVGVLDVHDDAGVGVVHLVGDGLEAAVGEGHVVLAYENLGL